MDSICRAAGLAASIALVTVLLAPTPAAQFKGAVAIAPASAVTTPVPTTMSVTSGRRTAITLLGAEAGSYDQARFALKGVVSSRVLATLGPYAQEVRPVLVDVPEEAVTGDYTLQLRLGSRWLQSAFVLRVTGAGRVMVASLKAAGGSDAKGGGKPGMQRLDVADLRSSRPAQVTPFIEHPLYPILGEINAKRPVVDRVDPAQVAFFDGYVWIRGSRLGAVPAVLFKDGPLEIVRQSDTEIVAHLPSAMFPALDEKKAVGGRIEPLDPLAQRTRTGPLQIVLPREATILANAPPETLVKAYKLIHPDSKLQPDLRVEMVEALPLAFSSSVSAGRPIVGGEYAMRFHVYGMPGDRLLEMRGLVGNLHALGVMDLNAEPTLDLGRLDLWLPMDAVTTSMNLWPKIGSSSSDRIWSYAQSIHFDLAIPEAPSPSQEFKVTVIEDTWQVRDLLGWESSYSWGITSGESDFGAGKVRVGLVEVGNDMAFRIASGPLGTEARWTTGFRSLPPGWLMEFEWEESQQYPDGDEPKAHVGYQYPIAETGLEFYLARDALPEGLSCHVGYRLADGSGPKGFTDSIAFGSCFYHFKDIPDGEGGLIDTGHDPWKDCFERTVTLQADATALNDHRVTLRLKRLRVTHPVAHSVQGRLGGVDGPTWVFVDGNYERVGWAPSSNKGLAEQGWRY